jgi:Periplasmic copper-binding protein (NosD)
MILFFFQEVVFLMKTFLKFLILALLVSTLTTGGGAVVVNHLGGGDYTSITAALSSISPGATIQIDAAANPYPAEGLLSSGLSNITVTSINGTALLPRTGLFISGSGWTIDNIILDGENEQTPLIGLAFSADNVVIRGCTLINPATGVDDNSSSNDLTTETEALGSSAAILIHSCQNVLIENNDMRSTNSNDAARTEMSVNQTCIFCSNQTGPATNLTIRNNQFVSESRNISIWKGWSNVTIEGNTFERADYGIGGAGSNILVSTERFKAADTTISSNYIIRDNTFTYANDSAIHMTQVRLDGMLIENNRFGHMDGFYCVGIYGAGSGVSILNNETTTCDSASFYLANGDAALGIFADEAISNVIIKDNHIASTARALHIQSDVNQGIQFEGNTIDLISNNTGAQLDSGSASALIRDNEFLRGGTSSVISLQASESVVSGNVLMGGRRGVAFIGIAVPPDTVVNNNNIVTRNLVVDPGLTGSSGEIFGIGDWATIANFAPPQNNRIIGNTIVVSAGDGVAIHGNGYQVYNNIIGFNTDFGITVGPTGSVSLADFNLYNGNSGGNYNNITPGANDILANPMFVLFFGVSTGADFHLQPGSPARNAGTSNTVDPDYVTDLGFYQDSEVDTAVRQCSWELYR